MAQTTTPTQLARDFREEFPTNPLDRLRWFRTRLGIDERRLILLMNLSPQNTPTLEDAVRKSPDDAVRVVELFLDLAERFSYDTKKLSEALHGPPDETAPGADRAGTLLNQIIAGGPGVVWQLFDYLRLHEVDSRARR